MSIRDFHIDMKCLPEKCYRQTLNYRVDRRDQTPEDNWNDEKLGNVVYYLLL